MLEDITSPAPSAGVRSSATGVSGELGVVTGVVVDFDFESRGQRPSVFTDGLGEEPQPVPLQPVRGSRKTIVADLACMLLIGLAIGIPLAISGSGSGSTAAPSPTGPTSTPAPSQTLNEGGGSEGSGANVPDGGSGAKDDSKAPSGSGAKDGVTSYDEAACLKACGECIGIKVGDGTDCDRIAYRQCCSK